MASESSEITGCGDARVEMNHVEKTREEARKCGDLLLITEAKLEIVNEHKSESLSQLDVRIGALFVCPVEQLLLNALVYFHLFPISIRSTFLCFPYEFS